MSSGEGVIKRKRSTNFNESDIHTLNECVNQHSDVLNSKKTNSSTPAAKNEAWLKIAASFNASQTSGVRSVEELKVKYKKMKANEKKILSEAANEIKKTGGGTAEVDLTTNLYGFSAKQIVGLNTRFDSVSLTAPSTEVLDDSLTILEQVTNSDEIFSSETSKPAIALQTPTTLGKKSQASSSQKIKLSGVKSDFLDLKVEALKLEIEHKKLDIENKKLDNEFKSCCRRSGL